MSSNAHIDRAYLKQAMSAPMLEAEHELQLASRWRDNNDEDALHELTAAYIRLVVSIAKRFRTYGLPFSDLVQEGSVGLMQAAGRFEPERGLRFSTYATWWIRAAIQDYVLKNWSIVRAGATVAHKSLFFSLRRLKARINETGDHLSPEARTEIARQLNVREIDVDHMAGRLSGSDRSLNAPIGMDGDAEWQDLLEDTADIPEELVANRRDDATLKNVMTRALKRLKPREQEIIRRRKLSNDPETLESIGKSLGVSKERIRQIELGALARLKVELENLAGGDIRQFGLLP